MKKKIIFSFLLFANIFLTVGGCSLITPMPVKDGETGLYLLPENEANLLNRHAPIFLVDNNQLKYNRIGTPTVKSNPSGKQDIYVDPAQATIYTMTQDFSTSRGRYTNLIYRIHFSKTPLPHLTAGDNVGILVYITLNSKNEAVLITTLHTCGCYLAIIPTSRLPENAWPEGWSSDRQKIYGEQLPGRIVQEGSKQRVVIDLRSATHRVMAVRYGHQTDYDNVAPRQMIMRPMATLDELPLADNENVSFFWTEGLRKGIVKGSNKPLEMIFIGLLAMDPFIGEDKALGPPEKTGVKMYTSLKFWARDSSNIWFFQRFLQYWGWNL